MCGELGLILDEWQQQDLRYAMAERKPGEFVASEVVTEAPRQNGKGGLLEARQIAGLFLMDRPLQIHSAHEYKTAEEHFLRMEQLISGAPQWLKARVKAIRRANGEQSIILKNGCRLRFLARSGGSGRGFSAPDIYLDEAFNIGRGVMSALRFTMSAQTNPQLWLTSSAPMSTEESKTLRSYGRRAAANDKSEHRLVFMSHRASTKPDRDTCTFDDYLELAYEANPALGIRIAVDTVETEFKAGKVDPDGWDELCRERLGIPDPDPSSETREHPIPLTAWKTQIDNNSKIQDRLVFGVDVNPARTWASIGVAGQRADGDWHGEIIDHNPGTNWIVNRLMDLVERHGATRVVLDPAGPAGALIAPLSAAGLQLTTVAKPGECSLDTVSAREHAQACGMMFDLVTAGAEAGQRFWHLGQPELLAAVESADKRKLGDAWGYRRDGDSDITPLVAVTLALRASVSLLETVQAEKPMFAW